MIFIFCNFCKRFYPTEAKAYQTIAKLTYDKIEAFV